MRIELKKELFDNDMYLEYIDNFVLVLNTIEESLHKNDNPSNFEHRISGVNIQLRTEMNEEDVYIVCPNIIGLDNGIIAIKSDLEELQGKPLTLDNMEDCYIVTIY